MKKVIYELQGTFRPKPKLINPRLLKFQYRDHDGILYSYQLTDEAIANMKTIEDFVKDHEEDERIIFLSGFTFSDPEVPVYLNQLETYKEKVEWAINEGRYKSSTHEIIDKEDKPAEFDIIGILVELGKPEIASDMTKKRQKIFRKFWTDIILPTKDSKIGLSQQDMRSRCKANQIPWGRGPVQKAVQIFKGVDLLLQKGRNYLVNNDLLSDTCK